MTLALCFALTGCRAPASGTSSDLSTTYQNDTADASGAYTSSEPGRYPKWFLETPRRDGVSFAVGYAKTYANLETSVQNASEDALSNLARMSKQAIRHSQAFVNSPEGMAFRGRKVSEDSVATATQDRGSKWALVDTAIVGNMVIVLAATEDVVVDGTFLSPPSEPSWIGSLPDDDAFTYAVGSCQSYYYEVSSWKEAEHAARLELARVDSTGISQVKLSRDRKSLGMILENSSSVLENLEITARHVDTKKGVHYVLARCVSAGHD